MEKLCDCVYFPNFLIDGKGTMKKGTMKKGKGTVEKVHKILEMWEI